MTRLLAAAAAATLITAAGAAAAAPARLHVHTTIRPGDTTTISGGPVAKGEFGFALRAPSDGAKDFVLTQRDGHAKPFTVVAMPGTTGTACEGAAGSVYCTGITTPAPASSGNYTFALRNRGNRPLIISLTITWRRVTSAG
ncbi:MAG: hypothetical protein U0Y82_15195 [Thermoleophilia bacterium]